MRQRAQLSPRVDSNNFMLSATSLNSGKDVSQPRNRRLPQETAKYQHVSQNLTGAITDTASFPSPQASASGPHPEVAVECFNNDVGVSRQYSSQRDLRPLPPQKDIIGSPLRRGWASFRDLTSSFIGIADDVPLVSRSDSDPTRTIPRDMISKVAAIQSNTSSIRQRDDRIISPHSPTTFAANSARDTSHSRVGQLGNYKQITCNARHHDLAEDDVEFDQMVYIHHVQPTDTYAGLTLRYRCHIDDIRNANGLWSRDNIQVRKWLAIPVTLCEIRGTPCPIDPTITNHRRVTDEAGPAINSIVSTETETGNHITNEFVMAHIESVMEDSDRSPWKHVRWVRVESFAHPVEIVRMSRRTLGFFPPRRKKALGIFDSSPASTPRQSMDVPKIPCNSTCPPSIIQDAPSRPASSMVSQTSTPETNHHQKPAWMCRPGGIGTLGKNVIAPGPDRDYLDTWAKKHLPGLNLDSYPSMSMAISQARDDFDLRIPNQGLISTSEDECSTVANSHQSFGLDRTASAVETWMREAFSTLRAGTHIKPFSVEPQGGGDLIELTDTKSDDGISTTGLEPNVHPSYPSENSSHTPETSTRRHLTQRRANSQNKKMD